MRWAYWDNLYFWRMGKQKLYMLLLGCRPEGRHTEQHDVFFHIGESLESLIPAIVEFWPEAKGKIHVDAWREVTRVGDFSRLRSSGALKSSGRRGHRAGRDHWAPRANRVRGMRCIWGIFSWRSCRGWGEHLIGLWVLLS
jgi:Domain of Unknown Function (DUF1543)